MDSLHWSRGDGSAVIGAIRFICSENGTTALLPTHRDLMVGFCDAIFRRPDIDVDSIPALAPKAFAARAMEANHRAQALEFLTLAPFIRPDIRRAEADLVAAYFGAAGTHSDALDFMTSIAHGRILRAQVMIARKLFPRLMPGGPLRQTRRIASMIRQMLGSRSWAAPYHDLAHCPEDTLGCAFYRFHRNRGFALPGERGCLPEELSAVHDITHILAGYNSDAVGEIEAQAFSGGTMPLRYSMMIAITGLLTYHNGVVFDAGGRVALQKGNLRPAAFCAALARGMTAVAFMSGWDFKADWMTPVDAIRARFRIENAVNVWDDPPPEQRVVALAA